MYSGRTHLRMAHEPETGKPDQYRRESDKAELPVGERHELGEAIAPEARRGERQEALDDKHQRKGRPKRVRHRLPPVTRKRRQDYFGAFAPGPPWLFRYRKNSELGSSTITSVLLRKVALYASRLR